MLGRLPWLALERRSRALRFFVFFDMGAKANGVAGSRNRSQTYRNDRRDERERRIRGDREWLEQMGPAPTVEESQLSRLCVSAQNNSRSVG